MVVNKTRQTPAQKRANAKFAAKQEKKMGKPRPEEKVERPTLPISKSWLLVLIFVVCGGALFEILKLFGLF
ncbi:hypothetical protein B0I75DRAFT_135374 [Yarrowia lipolytica]|uniref:Stress-associated endoplasmic reticulum protein n=1 Tax=Yarrowia lipolytica TaxID=4952 RepID=A0A1H6Q7Q3_YARLL|nr:hypothetical protein YALI1_D32494g [Yarrowia lipolytica]KAJ8053972.1 hypothetical protein LXG23DRAFT_55541 [Yarrowia lipolytica]QNP98082.1 Stress-associated endoplasmic reticulum protein [Yarrowia lipolytica]RDW47764.1 hypothetical protein B0I74DRAFT_134690 [Yarrowia lipolytica]RDW53984.1 hypothetical protein B0I75DRAFT_135374 [Yarrowia lipolytica]